MKSEIFLRLKPKTWFRWFALLLGTAFAILACNLTKEEDPNQTISFNRIYDSLARFDSVQIVMKDTGGYTIDNLYHGKVDTISEIMNLPAPHWDGGLVLIAIYGYTGGELVYHMDRKFNGANDESVDTTYVILPNTRLEADSLEFNLFEGDSGAFPQIKVSPDSLKDMSIAWTSAQPTLLTITRSGLLAKKSGTVLLTAALVSNPTKTLTFTVTILRNPSVPDSISISPETLYVAANGAPLKASIKVKPASADPSVTWMTMDSGVAHVSLDGTVQGIKSGNTLLWARSIKKPAISDTIQVVVSDPLPVEKVHFPIDSLDIFIGGAAESLWVEVIPSKANPKVSFRVVDPTIVSLVEGKLLALRAGTTIVIAQSIDYPEKVDTLKINAFVSETITSVSIMPDSLTLYTGGTTGTLTGKVIPSSAVQSLKWRSGNTSVATVDAFGIVTPVGAGKTNVTVVSRVDSTKQASVSVVVKRDVPKVSVGADTVIGLGKTLSFRPGVAQEYGRVAEFKWDLDGDGVWDGSSDSIKTVSQTFDIVKEYRVAFYVKDSEGNDTIVVKKVKVVNGPAVAILLPKDNTVTRQLLIDVSWTVNGVAQDSLLKQILKIGSNTVTRSAKDEAGNVYSAAVTVIVDTTPPAKPIVNGSAYASTKNPTWTWASGGLGGAGVFKVWMDLEDPALAKEILDTTYSPATGLFEGSHTLFVAERDAAGNWSAAGKFTVLVDVTKPQVPILSSSQTSPTSNSKPTWSWTKGDPGDVFEVKLDSFDVLPSAALTFTPSNELVEGNHTFSVRARDSASNRSDYATLTLFVDRNNPSLAIDGANPRTSNSTSISLSGTVGDGIGSGVKSLTISGASSGNGAVAISGGTWTKTGLVLVSGPNTLTLTATDKAGRVSSATVTVNVNVPVSVVVITNPAKGFVTNSTSVLIKYKIDNGAEQSISKTLVEGANSFDIVSSANELGQTGKDNIIVYSRPNVVFVREGGTGKKDGSSWEDAIGDLNLALTSANEGKEIWVAKGTYPAFVGFYSVKMFGGFDAVNHQNDTASRGKSTVGGFRIRGLGVDASDLTNTTLMDGFNLACYANVNLGILTMTSCQMLQGAECGGILVDQGGRLTLNNLQMNGITYPSAAIRMAEDAGSVTINGGSFTNNNSDECLIKMLNGSLEMNGQVSLSGNNVTNPIPVFGKAIIWETDGRIDVNDPVVLPDAGGLYWEGGRYYYHGNRIH